MIYAIMIYQWRRFNGNTPFLKNNRASRILAQLPTKSSQKSFYNGDLDLKECDIIEKGA